MSKFFIQIGKIEHGWTQLIFKNENESISITVSYVLDGLSSLLDATYNLNSTLDEIEVTFFSEPDEHRLLLKKNNDKLKLQIYYLENYSFDPLNYLIGKGKGKLVFDIEISLRRFTNQVLDLFYNLLNQYGEDEYKKLWHRTFPKDLYEKLKNIRKN